eukprot:TRINITY_DN3301_c0_g1_i4.p1 TRINITY_DN3301_c0_g1~~TRINITY_DN3301_c0_g1_i4.p1  ORF type:complete len:210 (-),score=9.29 TRINITY_DN3301_c0_g1_i4:129-683(-)
MTLLSDICPEFGPFANSFFTPCFILIFVYGFHGIIFTLYAIYHLTRVKESKSEVPYFQIFVSTFCSLIIPLLNLALLVLQLQSPSGLYILFYASQLLLFTHLLPFLLYTRFSHFSKSNYLLPFLASYLFIFGFELQLVQDYSYSPMEIALFYLKFIILLCWTGIVFVSVQNNKKDIVGCGFKYF